MGTLRTDETFRLGGIYQTTCACRTAALMVRGQSAPRCVLCQQPVEWVMVTPLPTEIDGREQAPRSGRETASGTGTDRS